MRLLTNIAEDPEGAAVYWQEQPYITEWFTDEQVAEVREKKSGLRACHRPDRSRGIASGEFFDYDSHLVALGYIGMTMGAYRWLRPDGRRSAKEIAAEFSTALLRGLIRDDKTRLQSPLGTARRPAGRCTPDAAGVQDGGSQRRGRRDPRHRGGFRGVPTVE